MPGSGNGVTVKQVSKQTQTKDLPFSTINADLEREWYVLKNAPQILAALIVRRGSTEPEHLIEPAIKATGHLYDQIKLQAKKNSQ